MLSMFCKPQSLASLQLKAAGLLLATCLNMLKVYAQNFGNLTNSNTTNTTVIPEIDNSNNQTIIITLSIALPILCCCLGLCLYNLKNRFSDISNRYNIITENGLALGRVSK